MRVAPEALDRRAALDRPTARVLEEPVDRGDRAFGAAHLVAPDAQPQVHGQPLFALGELVQLLDVAGQLQPGGVDLAGRLGDPHLGERVLFGLFTGVRGPDALALVLDVRVVGALGHADDRRGDRGRVHRTVREPVQRPGVHGLARHLALRRRDEAERPVLRHEDVLDDDVVRAGAAQAHRVPDVHNGVVI